MADAENKIQPNTASILVGAGALLSSFFSGKKSAIGSKEFDQESGRIIIIYSLDEDRADPPNRLTSNNLLPYDIKNPNSIGNHPNASTAVEQALRDIEAVANVKFVKAITEEDKEKAKIRFFGGDIISTNPDYEFVGVTNSSINPFANRDIFINTGSANSKREGYFSPMGRGYGAILHETLHALGISHPNASGKPNAEGGDNHEYDNAGTVMSYNLTHSRFGLGPYDVAALQSLYSAPSGFGSKNTFRMHDLLSCTCLHSKLPASLDFSDDSQHGRLTVDLSGTTPADSAIRYSSASGPSQINMLGAGTRIQHVKLGENMEGYIRGNELANTLIGGNRDDVFRAHLGGDTLTGGKGFDQFVFGGDCGHKNTVTDFNVNEDLLRFHNKLNQFSLNYDAGRDSSLIHFEGEDSAPSGSVRLEKVSLEQARTALIRAGVAPDRIRVSTPDDQPPDPSPQTTPTAPLKITRLSP